MDTKFRQSHSPDAHFMDKTFHQKTSTGTFIQHVPRQRSQETKVFGHYFETGSLYHSPALLSIISDNFPFSFSACMGLAIYPQNPLFITLCSSEA